MREKIRQLEEASRPLDPDAPSRHALRDAVLQVAEEFLDSADARKAFEETADRGAGLRAHGISPDGVGLEEVISILENDVIRPGGHPAAPGHLAYLTGGGIYHAALGDFLAAVTNKYAGLFFTGPGPVRMENLLMRWVSDLVGYPAASAGSIASGGSLANFTAVTTARDAHSLRGADYASAVVYLTSQTHHCIQKALRLSGMGEAQVRYVPVDDRFRMRPDALQDAITADRRDGLRPWMIVGTAGTVDTGAVDPLEDLARIAECEACWFHVDAAYGGFFLMTDHGREVMRGVERSDSVVLDPHKSLFLPWGSGIVLARDARFLTATHSASGDYLQDAPRDTLELSPADVSPELTKPFRALRMWLPLMLLGERPFRAALDEKLLLGRYFYREVQRLGFEVGPPPELSLVTYRWASAGASLDESNRQNQAIVDAMRRDGRVFISSTMIDGRFTLRMAALSFRTHLRHIDLALELLREQVTKVRESPPPAGQETSA